MANDDLSGFDRYSVPIAIVLWLAIHMIWGKSDLHYPPSPKRLPIIENSLDIDLKEPWHVTYVRWGKIYGLLSCHAWLITYLYAGDIVLFAHVWRRLRYRELGKDCTNSG